MNTRATEGENQAMSESRRSGCATTLLSVKPDTSNTPVEFPNLGSGRYELCEEIERGGMGIIYRAKDRQLEREVAIKVLRSEYCAQFARSSSDPDGSLRDELFVTPRRDTDL